MTRREWIMLAGLLFLVYIALHVISQGGLIQACMTQATGGRGNLRDAWRIGVSRILP